MRYYVYYFGYNSQQALSYGFSSSTTQIRQTFELPVNMRVQPTFNLISELTSIKLTGNGSQVSATEFTYNKTCGNKISLTFKTSTVANKQVYVVSSFQQAEFAFDAEIY